MIGLDEIIGLDKQNEPHPAIYCQKCVFLHRDKYKEFHNHYWRTQLTAHKHALMLINKLSTLINKEAVLRFSEVGNELTTLYDEGLGATEAGHYIERHNVDLTFGASCDSCACEVEFLLFTCLGCRTHSICETCYFKQLEEDDELTEDEIENDDEAN